MHCTTLAEHLRQLQWQIDKYENTDIRRRTINDKSEGNRRRITRDSGRADWRSLASRSGLLELVSCITQYPTTPGMTPHTVAKAKKNGFESLVLVTSHLHVRLFSHSSDIILDSWSPPIVNWSCRDCFVDENIMNIQFGITAQPICRPKLMGPFPCKLYLIIIYLLLNSFFFS